MSGRGDDGVDGSSAASEEMVLVERAAEAVRERWDGTPRALVVLGTGLEGLVGALDVEAEIPTSEIPGFAGPARGARRSRLLLGRLEGAPVAALQGPAHRYEGFDLRAVTRPVRVARALGGGTLILTGACGCVNPRWEEGDPVLVSDHLNLMGDNPLVGENVAEQGPRFPDMSEAYDRRLRKRVRSLALERGIQLREGVYAAVSGPCLETPAERRMLRRAGADVVGMSVVPEAIVANHCGMRAVALVVVTDVALPDAPGPVDVGRGLEVAAAAEPSVTGLVKGLVAGVGAAGAGELEDG